MQPDSCCGAPSLGGLCLLPRFADVVSKFVDVIFLLFQGIQDNAHRSFLQADSLHFIFQLVLEVAKSQGCVDEHQQQRKSDAEHKDHDTPEHGYEEVAG